MQIVSPVGNLMAPIPIANIYFAIDVDNLVSLIKKGFEIMVSQYGGIETLYHKKQ